MARPLEDLLQKEMSRKEFLATIGFGVASIAGLSTLLTLLGKNAQAPEANSGYGISTYGR